MIDYEPMFKDIGLNPDEQGIGEFYARRVVITGPGFLPNGKTGDAAADIRLIAAAPALLAALQNIDANAAESVEWIRRVARAAIAKATRTP